MRNRLIELHQERGRLLERIAAQRGILSQQMLPLQGVFSWTDRVAKVVADGKAFVQRHPLGIAAALASVVLLKPRTVWRWTQRGLVAWRTVRTWRNLHTMVPAFLLDKFRIPR